MTWFSIGYTLLFPALLIVVSYLLVRVAHAGRRTYQALEQTNQKLDRVVAELRMARLRQLGEAPAETTGEPPVEPRALPPAPPSPEPALHKSVPLKPAPPRPEVPPAPPLPPPEVFAPDVKCYYCGRSTPTARYLGQPICAVCRQNALLTDEAAGR